MRSLWERLLRKFGYEQRAVDAVDGEALLRQGTWVRCGDVDAITFPRALSDREAKAIREAIKRGYV